MSKRVVHKRVQSRCHSLRWWVVLCTQSFAEWGAASESYIWRNVTCKRCLAKRGERGE